MSVAKAIFIAIVLLLYAASVFAQTTQDDTSIIKAVVKPRSGDSTLYLQHSVGWKFMKEHLNKRSVKGIDKATSNNSIDLCKAEYRHIKQQIKQQADYVWKDSLFSNATIIADTALWEYFEGSKKKWVYGFSKLIYLRYGTICLLYYQGLCGRDCGRNEVAFFRKENGVWVKWILVAAGDY